MPHMIPILYRDSDLVVVNKPAGLLVHRTQLARGETEFAMQMVRDQIGKHVYPVHRLDRPVSGALIFALSKEVARSMSELFAERRIRKEYVSIVRGIAPEKFAIDHPLHEEIDPITDVKATQDKPAQEALTVGALLAQVELPVPVDRYPSSRYSLVRVNPLTGRKHQIRRHLRHIHHPIIGDVTHGSGKHNRFFEQRFGRRRLYLACTALEFKHPVTARNVVVRAPLCESFLKVFREFGWNIEEGRP